MQTPTVSTSTHKRNLPVKLTTDELLDRGNQLAEALTEEAKIEVEKSISMKRFKERLGGVLARVDGLKTAISEQVEYRDVECETKKDLIAKKVRIIRLDTLETVEERDLHPAEGQTTIPGTDPDEEPMQGRLIPLAGGKAAERATTEAAGATEEQSFADTPEEAEELRAQRIAEEESEREPDPEAPKAKLQAPKRPVKRKALQVQDENGNTLATSDDAPEACMNEFHDTPGDAATCADCGLAF